MANEENSSNPSDKLTAALRQILSATPADVRAAIAAAKEEKFSYHTKYSPDPEDSHA
ncbi:hypothetical protein GRAN_1736 [Granulicella sibirica]|uniref:Uncharacterized protein n=1 Tax=Granulicella sibirica TaxID=2479048 RepID=A0A4Q0T9J5_9BACT|nr:hypothetical protein GRAN_1736 [Granulicella sibirica]